MKMKKEAKVEEVSMVLIIQKDSEPLNFCFHLTFDFNFSKQGTILVPVSEIYEVTKSYNEKKGMHCLHHQGLRAIYSFTEGKLVYLLSIS